MATAGKRIVLSDGKFGVLSTGKWSTADADGDCAECCTEWGLTCNYYKDSEGRTPKYISVTFADISLLPCSLHLETPGGYGQTTVVPDIGPNDTFILEQVTECTWVALIPCEATVILYSDECVTYDGDITTDVIWIWLDIAGAEFPNTRDVSIIAAYAYSGYLNSNVPFYVKWLTYQDGLNNLSDIALGDSDTPVQWNRYTGGTAIVKAVL